MEGKVIASVLVLFCALEATAMSSKMEAADKKVMRRVKKDTTAVELGYSGGEITVNDVESEDSGLLEALQTALRHLEKGPHGLESAQKSGSLASAVRELEGVVSTGNEKLLEKGQGKPKSVCKNWKRKVKALEAKSTELEGKMTAESCGVHGIGKPGKPEWAPTSQDCTNCFPVKGNRAHLRSPCSKHPDEIDLPKFSKQKNANCPFLGTLTNEGIVPDDWMINETVWRAASFSSDRNGKDGLGGLKGHFAGNFRDHSTWVDKTNKVNSVDLDGEVTEVDCQYWYLNPVNMEGMSNEHSSSVGISDCPTDWSNCYFDCNSAGEWKCEGLDTNHLEGGESFADCQDKLPNSNMLDQFIQTISKDDGDYNIDNKGEYVTTCMLAKFASDVAMVHAMKNESAVVEDFHFFTPTESFGADCDHSFTEDGSSGTEAFLEQTSSGTGGHIGGGIVGGYIDLVHFFGEIEKDSSGNHNTHCPAPLEKTKLFKLKIGDLERIDIKRKMPCTFPRKEFFAHMAKQNDVTDRRKGKIDDTNGEDWEHGCNL